VLAMAYSNLGSYHIGVITSAVADGGNLRRSSAITDAFIVHDNGFDGSATHNYQGSLASALTSIWPSSAASTEISEPLASTRAALDNNAANAGFVRSDAFFGIVMISGTDDGSAQTPLDYATFVKGTKTDPSNVFVSAIVDPAAARLDSFIDQFPNRNDVHSVFDTDYAGALVAFTQLYRTVLGYACHKAPADLDPDLPGDQIDCSFIAIENGVEKLLPQCKDPVTQPCWEIVTADATICTDPMARAHLQTRGYTTSMSAYGDPFHPAIRGQCVVN